MEQNHLQYESLEPANHFSYNKYKHTSNKKYVRKLVVVQDFVNIPGYVPPSYRLNCHFWKLVHNHIKRLQVLVFI